MDGMLSQEEINALLGGADTGSGAEDVSSANSESPISVWEPQLPLFLFW